MRVLARMIPPTLQVAAVISGSILGSIVFILFIVLLAKSIRFVKEREVMIVERLGKYRRQLSAGVHLLAPIVDRPKVG